MYTVAKRGGKLPARYLRWFRASERKGYLQVRPFNLLATAPLLLLARIPATEPQTTKRLEAIGGGYGAQRQRDSPE